MKYIEATEKVDSSRRERLADILLDLILDSGNADKLTPELARPLIDAARGNRLSSGTGLAILLEAGAFLEPEKTPATLETQGFPELAIDLKKPIRR